MSSRYFLVSIIFSDIMGEVPAMKVERGGKEMPGCSGEEQSGLFLLWFGVDYAPFTLSQMALKAAGLLRARSARTLRLISMPALWMRPISLL